MSNTLVTRIEAATGIAVPTPTGQHKLSGIFNRYRPDGAGLERLFEVSGIEGEILSRLKKVFLATTPSWKPGDLYFTIRQHVSIDPSSAATIVESYLAGFKRFAAHIGDSDVTSALDGMRVVFAVPIGASEDADLGTMMYECLTDFLATLQPGRHELFLLKEALYSIANDYFLMAYILWPAFGFEGELAHALDNYFDVWRYGISLRFFKGGNVTIGLPG